VDDLNLIGEAVSQRKDAIAHRLSAQLTKAFPDKHLLETEDHLFRVTDFAYDGHCTAVPKPDVHNQLEWGYDGSEDHDWVTPYNTWLGVQWEGHDLEVITIGFFSQHCRTLHHYVLSPNEEISRSFLRTVCRWHHQVREEVLVFDGGHWQKSKDLYQDIQAASFDNLVLPRQLKQELIADLSGFFEAKAKYDQYGIAWKRGVLLLGPPGNGKTHAVKAAINMLGKPCLYVKSFDAHYQTPHDNIRAVFHQARQTAPCILIFEDLDSLIDAGNRSFFLNEMDGFASNSGILTIATTNHPERLDPSILDRPSRFDRKYTFNLPGADGREAFLTLFAAKLEPALHLDPQSMAEVVAATSDYSYAYLKELYLSSMMRWISLEKPGQFGDIMLSQCEALKAQMATEPPLDSIDSDLPDPRDPMAYARQYMSRFRR
jgi:hypothetical protein